MLPLDPLTQTCPELCPPSSAAANALKAPFAIAAVTAAAFGRNANAPMFRVTVGGPLMRFTGGGTRRSHDGNACSSLDFQYGMHTVGSTIMSRASIRRRKIRRHGRKGGVGGICGTGLR